MIGGKMTSVILFLALCIAFGSAARCNRPTTLNKGTQTPRVWQWQNNPHRWWDDYRSPMRLWLRPNFWNKAFDHIGGFPMLPLPLGRTMFNNQFDQLIDELFEDPWDRSAINSIEGQDHTQGQQNCLCSGSTDDQSVATETNSADDDDQQHFSDQQQRRYSQEVEDSFPRYRDTGVQAEQTRRNTLRNDENTRYRDNNLRNHQHHVQRNIQNRRLRENNGNMGSYASNQQPTMNRNNIRQTNQGNLKRQTEVEESNDVYNEFNRHDRYNVHRNTETEDTRFGHGSHGTMPNNRDSHMAGRNQNSHMRNHVTKPVEVYSLQVPGYKPSELQVKVEGRKVRVLGKQACGCQDSCSVREFERVSILPEGIDTRNLQATLNKEGTLSVQSKNNQRLARGHYEDRDILVEGLDLPPIEDSSKNTENCVKKASIKLAKIDKLTGKRVPLTRQYEEVPQQTFENEYDNDGVTIEVVEE